MLRPVEAMNVQGRTLNLEKKHTMPSNHTVWTQGVTCPTNPFVRHSDGTAAVSSPRSAPFSGCVPIPKSLTILGRCPKIQASV